MNENNFVTNNIFHGAAILVHTGTTPDTLFDTDEKYFGRPVIYMLWNDIDPELVKKIRTKECQCEVNEFALAYRKIRTILHKKIEEMNNGTTNSTAKITTG